MSRRFVGWRWMSWWLFAAGTWPAIVTAQSTVSQETTKEAEPAEMTPDEKAKDFIRYFERQVRPLEIESNRAWWNANVAGTDENYQKKRDAENLLNETLASEFRFEQVKSIRAESIQDPLLRRQMELLYLRYLSKQVDPDLLRRMTDKANAIEHAFNLFRAKVGDQELKDSEVRDILKKSSDSQERQAAWEASKEVGRVLEQDLRELVQLRNESARKLGFENYHVMQLSLSEQSPQDVLKLFDQLEALTRAPFQLAKAEIDQRLAAQYRIPISDLRPWHYQDPFFQEAPDVYGVDVDEVFAKVDIPKVCETFYSGIGLPVTQVIAASDLFYKQDKSPHAFCTDINRDGDVRVLTNIVPNEYWMATTLHELGHSVYTSTTIPATLPYLLRTDAHILATEGMAMMFERFAGSAEWLGAMGVQVADPATYDDVCRRNRRNKLLIFSRWCQVMLRFEMGMYGDPSQDLNKLWWDLVEKYQLIRRPDGRSAPDYASKIHVVSAPAYYHNYMMGELFACQLHAAVAREVLKAGDPRQTVYYQNPGVGKFLQERVFNVGATKRWDELTREATGADLNAQAFAREFSQ